MAQNLLPICLDHLNKSSDTIIVNLRIICFELLAALYYTLDNIKPANRSRLNAIQLLELIPRLPDSKAYGIESLLQAFMEDLFQLEQVN